MVKKITQIMIVLILLFAIPLAASAATLMWNEYTDDRATKLIIESSTDNKETWNTTYGKDPIDTGLTGATVPNGPENSTVYYRMKAVGVDDNGDPVQSSSSNIVSYYWTTGGGGTQGLQTPVGIGFVDCTASNLSTEEQTACSHAGF